MIQGTEVWELVKPDVKSIAEKLFLAALVPSVEQIVKDSSNPYDDAFFAMFKPIFLSAIKEQLGHL